MKGYRTIIINAVALLASVLALSGLDVGVDHQAAIVAGIMALGNMILRKVTTTPLGQK